MSFGDRVQKLRESIPMSQQELADKAGLNVWTIAKIEQGQRPDPAWSTVCALARALGVSVEDFPHVALAWKRK